MSSSLGGPKMPTRDWNYIEERLLSPSVRLGEAIARLRSINYHEEANRLLRAQQALQDECRAVHNLMRPGRRL